MMTKSAAYKLGQALAKATFAKEAATTPVPGPSAGFSAISAVAPVMNAWRSFMLYRNPHAFRGAGMMASQTATPDQTALHNSPTTQTGSEGYGPMMMAAGIPMAAGAAYLLGKKKDDND